MAQPVYKPRRKKTLGSYPYLTGVFSISLALLIFGLFGLVSIYANQLTELIKANIQIQVYLDRTVEFEEIETISQVIASYDFVEQGEKGINFISKQKAAQQFIAETGEDFVNFLGDNPLRDAFIVHVKEAYTTPREMQRIKEEFEKIPGVFEVEYIESLVEAVNANVAKIGIVLVLVALFMVVAVVVLINNTIKLALFSQRFLIRSMQLVGAKKWFIIRPFIMRAAGQGLVAAVIALLALNFVMNYAYSAIPDLITLHQPDKIGILAAVLLVGGIVLGASSAYFAVNRYLKLSLDELY